ncbi:MAG: thioredoxin-dependent thiol peroxidase [Verrucomicrobia bacterium]|nr:thioredoxin-dependent thiol peroxidase [Verrucomicrobiota bacterium]
MALFHSVTADIGLTESSQIDIVMLKEGSLVSQWSLPADGGKVVSSQDLLGKEYILYFYPKDDTPGCTREACGFRDSIHQFEKLGMPVFGVSVDPVQKHEKFVEKYQLNFPLLSDENRTLVNEFGLWGEKKFMGKTYMGTSRATFWIGADGKVKKVWSKVKPETHAEEVLQAVKGEG